MARAWVVGALLWVVAGGAGAQSLAAASAGAGLRLRIVSSLPGQPRFVPAVIWLDELAGGPAEPDPPARRYTLIQKHRAFSPHLLVVPVGSAVVFPNEDPFFHNVFSLYKGKRFDLGLYESGSEKTVTFSQPGVSYIFCNIHPEMSAVIIALRTPLYAVAPAGEEGRGEKQRAAARFQMRGIPAGDYELHVWIEGVPDAFLGRLDRRLHIEPDTTVDLGTVEAPIADARTIAHKNLYGRDYTRGSPSPYDGGADIVLTIRRPSHDNRGGGG